MRFISLAAFLFSLFIASSATAADVRFFDKNGIIIEGEIVEGDFARVVALLDKSRGAIDTVSIYSMGGSVPEAIQIGTLLRDMRLRTVVPKRWHHGRGNVCPGIYRQGNCTCMSSCVLVFAGGIHYEGNVVGVHRSYISREMLSAMRGMNGDVVSRQLVETVSDYLRNMGFPQHAINTMNATRPQDMRMLYDREIREFLSGFVPSFDDRLNAACATRRADGVADTACRREAEKRLRDEVYAREMKKAKRQASLRFKYW